MSDYPNPCDNCQFAKCVPGGCRAWELYYLHRQELINAWAKKHKVKPIPTPLKNPCDTCEVEDCRAICKARAVYWDKAMEKLRKEMGM